MGALVESAVMCLHSLPRCCLRITDNATPSTQQLGLVTQSYGIKGDRHLRNALANFLKMSNMHHASGSIIFLNGFPGVSKLAIARAINVNLDKHSDGNATRLVDNHVLIDPAQAIISGIGPSNKNLQARIRQVAFEALKEEFETNSTLTVIMTGCLADTDKDTSVLVEHLKLAQASKVPIYFVNLTCNREEHGRSDHPDMYLGSRTKLGDVAVFHDFLNHYILCQGDLRDPELVSVMRQCVLDTSLKSIQESCIDVLDWVRSFSDTS